MVRMDPLQQTRRQHDLRTVAETGGPVTSGLPKDGSGLDFTDGSSWQSQSKNRRETTSIFGENRASSEAQDSSKPAPAFIAYLSLSSNFAREL